MPHSVPGAGAGTGNIPYPASAGTNGTIDISANIAPLTQEVFSIDQRQSGAWVELNNDSDSALDIQFIGLAGGVIPNAYLFVAPGERRSMPVPLQAAKVQWTVRYQNPYQTNPAETLSPVVYLPADVEDYPLDTAQGSINHHSPAAGIGPGVLPSGVRFYRTYNVYDYGAKGDGVTDDTNAIQAAINDAQANNGGEVYFFPGVFLISAPLAISQDNVTLRGAGNGSVLQPKAGFSGAAMVLYVGSGSGGGINRLSIRDLQFYGGTNTTASNPACDAIQLNSPIQDTRLEHVQFNYINGWAVQILAGTNGFIGYSVLSDCVSKKCSYGYHFASTQPATNRTGGIVMTNCVADDCKLGDSYYFEEVIDNVLWNCQGYSNNSGGASLHIKGCAFTFFGNMDLGGGGTQTTPCVLIEKGSAHSNDHVELFNILIQKGQPGLLVTGAAHLRVTDCDVYFNQTHGIQINDDASNGMIEIRGCHFYQNNRNSAASTYDLNNLSTHGHLLVRDNQFDTTVGGGADQVAASLASPNFWGGLDVQGNAFTGGSPALSPTMIQKTIIRNNAGYNPVGSVPTPNIPATGVAQQNDRGVDCTVIITSLGTLTQVAIGGVAVGVAPAAGSQYRVPALQTITLTYAGAAPAWQWFGD